MTVIVVVEGLEGSGKTTVVQHSVAALQGSGLTAVEIGEFSTSPLGDYLLRRLSDDRFLRDPRRAPTAWTQVFSVAADLAYAMEYSVVDAARHHQVVIKDRGWESLVACQHVALVDEYGLADHAAMQSIATITKMMPDPATVRIWLDAPEEVRVRRLIDRQDFDREDLPVLRRREIAYRWLLDDERVDAAFVHVDSSRPINEVVAEVLTVIGRHLPLRVVD